MRSVPDVHPERILGEHALDLPGRGAVRRDLARRGEGSGRGLQVRGWACRHCGGFRQRARLSSPGQPRQRRPFQGRPGAARPVPGPSSRGRGNNPSVRSHHPVAPRVSSLTQGERTSARK